MCRALEAQRQMYIYLDSLLGPLFDECALLRSVLALVTF